MIFRNDDETWFLIEDSLCIGAGPDGENIGGLEVAEPDSAGEDETQPASGD